RLGRLDDAGGLSPRPDRAEHLQAHTRARDRHHRAFGHPDRGGGLPRAPQARQSSLSERLGSNFFTQPSPRRSPRAPQPHPHSSALASSLAASASARTTLLSPRLVARGERLSSNHITQPSPRRSRRAPQLELQYPTAAPSLRGSEPPSLSPVAASMVIPCACPASSSHAGQRFTRWPRRSSSASVASGKRASMFSRSRGSPIR